MVPMADYWIVDGDGNELSGPYNGRSRAIDAMGDVAARHPDAVELAVIAVVDGETTDTGWRTHR